MNNAKKALSKKIEEIITMIALSLDKIQSY
jgi:hypothetical protein